MLKPWLLIWILLVCLPLSSLGFTTAESQRLALLGSGDLKTLALSEIIDVWLAFESFGNTRPAADARAMLRHHLGAIKTHRLLVYLEKKHREDPLISNRLLAFENELRHSPNLGIKDRVFLLWQDHQIWLKSYGWGWLFHWLLSRLFPLPSVL